MVQTKFNAGLTWYVWSIRIIAIYPFFRLPSLKKIVPLLSFPDLSVQDARVPLNAF
jgi:hypothetical protein